MQFDVLTTVIVSVATNNVPVLKLLCRHGADMTILDQHGATTVHYSAQGSSDPRADTSLSTKTSSDVTTLKAMLSAGVDPNCRDENARTPLMWAATSGYQYRMRQKSSPLQFFHCFLSNGSEF